MFQPLNNMLNTLSANDNLMDERFESQLSLLSDSSSESSPVDQLPDENIQWMKSLSQLQILSPSTEAQNDVVQHVQVPTFSSCSTQMSPQAPQLKKIVACLPVMIPRHLSAGMDTTSDCNTSAAIPVRSPAKNTASDCNTRAAIPVRSPAKNTATDCSHPTSNHINVELKPLKNPVEGMSQVFSLLSSDDWEKKNKGMQTIQALTRYHPKILMPKLHQVCTLLAKMVEFPRSAVACVAANTLLEMYANLKRGMDPEAELTGQALLQKMATTSNSLVNKDVNAALDALVQNCSYNRIVNALLNTGLNHRSVAVRESAAQHLHQLADRVGADHMMTARRDLTCRVLRAVSKMSVDAAQGVRKHGLMILKELALHKNFQGLWDMVVPESDRFQLGKLFAKLKRQKQT